ncbi:MAG: hypothetical protein NVSMB51_12590 [Solirubrobacteraceae bacterium]
MPASRRNSALLRVKPSLLALAAAAAMFAPAPARAAISGGAGAPSAGGSGGGASPLPATPQPSKSRAPGSAPRITGARCVSGPLPCPPGKRAVAPNGTLLLTGRHLASGMSAVFPRTAVGASRNRTIGARLRRSGHGFLVVVPAGAHSGRIVVLTTRGLRSLPFGPIYVHAVKKPKHQPAPGGGAAPLPASNAGAFAGNAMWIWYLSKSDGGNLDAISARAQAGQFSTVYIKSSDGSTNFWPQFTAPLVQSLHQRGIRVCAWQYVYGTHPVEEAQLGARAVQLGADCLIIDAEAEYEGKYAAAQSYVQTLRSAVGASFPIALAAFPYVDYHESFPYSVFLGPGGAQFNMPQMYWHAIGTTVDRVFSHTYTENLIYGRTLLPLGQTYGGTPPSEIVRFRELAQAYNAPGVSFWDWQETTPSGWTALDQALNPVAAPDISTDYPSLGSGAKGDQVLVVQEHLAAAQPQTPTSGIFDAATSAALQSFQSAKGLPATGTTDAATWRALLALSPVAVDWTAR